MKKITGILIFSLSLFLVSFWPASSFAAPGAICQTDKSCASNEKCVVTGSNYGDLGKCVSNGEALPATTDKTKSAVCFNQAAPGGDPNKFVSMRCFKDQDSCFMAQGTSGLATEKCVLTPGMEPGKTYDLSKKSCYISGGSTQCSDTQAECEAKARSANPGNPPQCNQNGGITNDPNINSTHAGECFWTTGIATPHFNLNVCMKQVAAWTFSMILWLVSKLLWLVSQIFNASIQLSIMNFSALVASPAISLIWGIGRDLANVFFIFILMYIAIATIVQKSGINTQKLVVELIITALLINFSIIIPKVIIDIGNSFANVFYQNMGNTDTLTGAPDVAGVLVNGINPAKMFGAEIGNAIQQTGVDTDPNSFTGTIGLLSWSTIISKSIGTFFLILILCYVLLVATYLFLARTIVLLIVIAMSSLVFFSRIVPSELKLNFWDKWWNALMSETFFAPVFMFMFYLVLMLASTGMPSTLKSAGTGNDWIMDILWYVLICGLAFGTIIVAKSMSKWSQQVASQFMKKGGGFVARNTIGRAAKSLADSKAMTGMASRAPLIGGSLRNAVGGVAGAKMGGQSFTGQLDATAKAAKDQMEGMDDKQKARFVENSTKRKITNFGMGGKFWMGQKEVNKLQAEQIKGMKVDENNPDKQVEQFMKSGDKGKVLKEAGHSTVARMMLQAEKSGNTGASDEIKKYRDGMDVEERQKLDDMVKKEKDRIKAKDRNTAAKDLAEKLADPTTRPAAAANAKKILQDLTPAEASKFMEENPDFYKDDKSVLSHLTSAQLGSIIRNGDMPMQVRKDIAQQITDEHTAAANSATIMGTPIPADIANKKKWLDNHPEFA